MKRKQFFYLLAASAMLFVGCGDSGSGANIDGSTKVSVKDGIFVDERDGNEYHVQAFGSDVWFVDNLRYADSSAMPNLKGNVWCPDDESSNCKKFGMLYSWTAARNIKPDYLKELYESTVWNVQGVCPDGWRIPTHEDWDYLRKVVKKLYPSLNVGDVVKSAEGWVDTAGAELKFDDRMGFNGEPTGRRNKEGGFLHSGSFAFFWTSQEINKATAVGWTLRNDNAVLDSGTYYKEHGMSVRCVATLPEEIEWSGDDEARTTRARVYDSVLVGDEYYKVIDIGGARWMAENLNIETESSRCYNDEKENCEKFGRLYPYSEIETACPEGWHLPDANEWRSLIYQVNGNMYALSAKDVWDDDVGTDEAGVSLLPGGTIDNGSFSDLGNGAYYWIANQSSPMCLRFYYYTPQSSMIDFKATSSAAIRCVED